jgi:nucleotide-binding universal stress UspA family protein
LGAKLGLAIKDGLPTGPLRAFPCGVTCARALGDRDCAPFVSPMPDMTVMPFPEGDAYVLIASAGVWDAISRETVFKTVLKARDAREAAEAIVSKALRAKGSRDDINDITCLCILVGRNRPELDAVAEEQREAQGFSHSPAGARSWHRPLAQRPGHHLRHDHRGAAPSSPDMIAEALRRAFPPGVSVELTILHGSPAGAILGAVERLGPDLLVMGTHGRTGLQRLLVGSVAEQVMRASPVPVVIVRAPEGMPERHPPTWERAADEANG